MGVVPDGFSVTGRRAALCVFVHRVESSVVEASARTVRWTPEFREIVFFLLCVFFVTFLVTLLFV